MISEIAIWDIENTTALEMQPNGKQIKRGWKGLKILTNKDLQMLYGPDMIYKWGKWPETERQLENERGAHWTMIGFLEQCKLYVVLFLTDLF